MEIDFGTLQTLEKQLGTAVALITLFPKEEEKFRQQSPVDKALSLLPDYTQEGLVNLRLRILTDVSHLTPEEKVPVTPDTFKAEFQLLRGRFGIGLKLELAAELTCLFPDRKEKIMKAVQKDLRETATTKQLWIADGFGLWEIKYAMELDPTLHTQFRKFLLNNRNKFKEFFAKITKASAASLSPSTIANWFAVYKLLLAEEITVTPSGILMAVEKLWLSRGGPLPERSET